MNSDYPFGIFKLFLHDLSRLWLSHLGSFGFIAPTTLYYLAFQSFDFERHLMIECYSRITSCALYL